MSNIKDTAAQVLETLVTTDGSYQTILTAKYKNRTPWKPKDPRQIISFIPGTITTVDVKVGDKIKEGDILLTFKAMKMQNTYLSPVAGVVAKIYVAPNEVVPKGVLLIEFK